MANKVIAGEYDGISIVKGHDKIKIDGAYKYVDSLVIARSVFNTFPINKKTVLGYQTVGDPENNSENSMLIGVLSAKKKGTHRILIKWIHAKTSIIELDDKLYALFLKDMAD
jgi:hypothetical protein